MQGNATKHYRFAGKERDEESGLYYFGARYYAPWLGRFTSIDPKASKYLHQTPYCYANNNPVSLIDFNGEGVEGEDKNKNLPVHGNVYQEVVITEEKQSKPKIQASNEVQEDKGKGTGDSANKNNTKALTKKTVVQPFSEFKINAPHIKAKRPTAPVPKSSPKPSATSTTKGTSEKKPELPVKEIEEVNTLLGYADAYISPKALAIESAAAVNAKVAIQAVTKSHVEQVFRGASGLAKAASVFRSASKTLGYLGFGMSGVLLLVDRQENGLLKYSRFADFAISGVLLAMGATPLAPFALGIGIGYFVTDLLFTYFHGGKSITEFYLD